MTFEKRKNSDKHSALSLGFAALLLIGGLIVGMQLGTFMQESPEDVVKPPQIDLIVDGEIDLSGEWIGTATEDYGIEARYDYRLVLTQNGDDITGMSYLDMASDPEIYSESPIAGTLTGSSLFYTEISATVLENIPMDNWCLSDTTVTYQILNGQETLVGTWELADWERDECGDISGRVILTRQAE